jgi:hypothetical protein
MTNHAKALPALLFICSLSLGTVVYAQAPDMPAESPASAAMPGAPEGAAPAEAAPVPIKLTPEELNAPFNGSFFLTPAEITAIQLAKLGKPVTAETLDTGGGIAPMIAPHRVISISGLLYRSPKDWIVWMNGKKVTPKELLPEIVDIKVESSSRVRLKWYDRGLNSVIAITLRPHQTYDITTGILLPGSEY